ncbi:MAG: short-chain dehydrogenase [Ignavibacteria bacterium]|nr:short-chain dehydrogenase [Ignavibacteriota bacterium]
MPHALIVGGTGMLAGVTDYFTQHGYTVSVIARNPAGLNKLIESKSEHGFINPVKVDYTDYYSLEERLRSAIDNYGEIETAVCWIHSTAPEAPYIIADVLNDQSIKCKYFHVLGCEETDPEKTIPDIKFTFERFVNLKYKKIILGFVIDDESTRWLTNTEISNGVTDAIINERDSYIVGKVEPWDDHPPF